MVKTKKTQVAGKRVTNGRLIDSSKTKAEVDLLGEDGWVIVKRQKVNIWVPPLPITKMPISPSPGRSQLQGQDLPQEKPSQFPTEKHVQMPSAEQEKSVSLASKNNIKIVTETTAPHSSALVRQPRPEPRVESVNFDRIGTSRTGKIIGVSNTSQTIRHPRVLHCQHMLLNQRMRASNLERKLQKAGGLSRWLVSLGLGQFVRLFPDRSLGKFQLVNLTMKKLKEMGADKVGPRRKLMHAIDCICQPYCFEAFKNVY